ncbi:MAG: QcrA and Rieske domain-containing protein [Nitrososphaerales archaeon]
MNRREFLRRITIVAAMGGVVLAGGVVLGQKLLGSSTNNIPTLGGTPPSTQPSTQATNPTTQSSATQSNSSMQTGATQSGSPTQSSTSQSSSTSNVPAGYVFLAALSQLTGNVAYFNHPTFGPSILVNVGGTWKAFSSTCTHQACTVGYNGSSIRCPCHGATFNPSTGAVTGGPAPTPIAEYATLVANNNLYVGNSIIN